MGALNGDDWYSQLNAQMNGQRQQHELQNLQGSALQQLYSLGQSHDSARNVACSAYISDFAPPKPKPASTPQKAKSMFKEIVCDVKGFILEHRSVIYFLAFALLVDHFVFRGAFKARLQGCVDRLVTKVEEKIQ